MKKRSLSSYCSKRSTEGKIIEKKTVNEESKNALKEKAILAYTGENDMVKN